MSDFVIDPSELTKSFEGKRREEKQTTTTSESKGTSSSTADVPAILQKEYTKLVGDLESYKTRLNETKDESYRKELLERIPRTERDLESLKLEIARIGGTVLNDTASANKTQNNNAGFVINPKELQSSFLSNLDQKNFDLNFGANNLRAMGTTNPDTANFIADAVNGLKPGTTAEIRARIANKNPVLEESRSLAQEMAPPTELESGHERWLKPRSAQPIPKALSDQMTTMTGGADVEGSGENVLAKNNAAVQKVRELGYNPAQMQTQGDILLTEPSRARPSTPNVWQRRAIGPASWMGANRQTTVAPTTTSPNVAPTKTISTEELAAMIKNSSKFAPLLESLGKFMHYGGAGFGAYDTLLRSGAFNRAGEKDETDIPGAIISGLGTAAQLASPYVPAVTGAVAGPLAASALPVVATVAPLINMARDRTKHLALHPEEHQLPPVVNGLSYGPMGEPYRQ
jgi:hypothetical protein